MKFNCRVFLCFPQPKTRVVVAKFPMGAVSVEELLVLGRPFGTIIKHLVFPAKVIKRIIKEWNDKSHCFVRCISIMLIMLKNDFHVGIK